ncbi:hypothetical protein PAXRUDRAFT_130118 [Paxillus rubicundulus Ve08.2h10]|uniref:Uncharacterized protein n=1 Tax=Paxillus rubicundulus Ve08.2h10 TaxID=930991 RepID=A0A0D0ED12_9AGAM|nr:hypothetical protein PAXRUDRAFT_130118 [Paxillus rubicundulus Ve08.2h10]
MDIYAISLQRTRPIYQVPYAHFFTQIPQPIHRNSDMNAILSVDLTSIQSFPKKSIWMSTLDARNAQHDTNPSLQQDMTVHETDHHNPPA